MLVDFAFSSLGIEGKETKLLLSSLLPCHCHKFSDKHFWFMSARQRESIWKDHWSKFGTKKMETFSLGFSVSNSFSRYRGTYLQSCLWGWGFFSHLNHSSNDMHHLPKLKLLASSYVVNYYDMLKNYGTYIYDSWGTGFRRCQLMEELVWAGDVKEGTRFERKSLVLSLLIWALYEFNA